MLKNKLLSFTSCTRIAPIILVLILTSANVLAQEKSGGDAADIIQAAPAAAATAGVIALAPPVGSYHVHNGPHWGTNPPTYNCLEACALNFGGVAADYQCSTDGGSINNMAWVSGYADNTHCDSPPGGAVPVAEDFKLNDFYDCGSFGCAYSAFVQDHCAVDFFGDGTSENFCFPASDFSKEIVSGNDVDAADGIDLAVEVGIEDPSMYDFKINYNQPDWPPVVIEDSVPAEWRVTDILDDSLNCVAAQANKGKKDDKSATQIVCEPETTQGMATIWAEARCHGNRHNTKCRPTSCGALYLNDGAAAFELDPDTGAAVEDGDGNRLPPLGTTNALCLVAVEDLDGGGIDYTGGGDEDGDGLLDHAEACEIGTDPCVEDSDGDGVTDFDEVASGCMDPLNPDTDGDTINDGDELNNGTDPCDEDTDGDGVRDDADNCPLEGPADPGLGEILQPDGCIRQSQCSDGVDNEPDGNTDFPDDASCDDILDDSEDTIDPQPDDCVEANGMTWCWNNAACGEACETVCASKGLTPVADSAAWFAAQDTQGECQAIADALGGGLTPNLSNWTYACLEDTYGTHSVGGGLVGPYLHCSTFNECPDNHRTNMDQLGVACGIGSRRSICPCE